MIGETFEDILLDIKEEYGARIFEEPNKLKALLADLANGFKRERVMLHTAIINTDIVSAIRECDESMASVVSARLISLIMDECGYDESSAAEIVCILFLVLKKRVPDTVRNAPLKSKEVRFRGNTVGNIVNSGCIAVYQDYIFYRNRSSGGSLYRMYLDGTGKIRMSDSQCSYINAVDGYVYYSNWSDGKKLYKVGVNGGLQTTLNDDQSVDVNVVDDWVYYSNRSDDGKLYKIRTNGLSKTRLTDEACSYAAVVDDWIYYANERDFYRIYKMRLDGSERLRLCEDECECLNVENGWIYYINKSDGDAVYSMSLTGDERVKICEHSCYYINVSGGWIYFTANGEKLHRIKPDGTDGIRLNNDKSRYINIAGDWIYYVNPDIADKFYKIRLGGSEKQSVY